MRTIRFLLEKEFRQIFRNRILLTIILFVPVVQLTILPLAANYEVKNINIAVVNNDHSTYARKLIDKITASGYFRLTSVQSSFRAALDEIERDHADLVLEIPPDFERNLVRENGNTLFVAVNAINGMKAGLGAAYLQMIIRDYNERIALSWYQ
jgi:ABC-2 type transport system permease protein